MTLKDTTAGGVEAAARGLISAWEKAAEGHYTPREISVWLLDYMKPAMDELRAALSPAPAPAPAAGMPEGWKLVPPEPTAEMIDAAFGKRRAPGWELARGIWKAMLAAAPSPKAGETGNG